MMKFYLKTIQFIQKGLIFISIFVFLIILPPLMVFFPDFITWKERSILFDLSLWAVFFVMIIRPLADLLPKKIPVRQLVILRKSVGIFSASIVLLFFFEKVIKVDGFLLKYFSYDFGFGEKYKILARLSEVTAIILLITSNNFSKKVLGKGGKRVQKLAYVYFYSGALYVGLVFRDKVAMGFIIIVSVLVFLAGLKNRKNKKG